MVLHGFSVWESRTSPGFFYPKKDKMQTTNQPVNGDVRQSTLSTKSISNSHLGLFAKPSLSVHSFVFQI